MLCIAFHRCLLAAVLLAVATTVCAVPPDTAFNRLLSALQTAPPQLRMEFARLALWHLAEAYLAEAELARSAQGENAGERMRWARSVEGYAQDLLLLMRDMEQDPDVSIQLLPTADAVVTVRGSRTMLTFPRPAQQLSFEQSLVEQFCQMQDCDALAITGFAAAQQSEPASATVDMNLDWAFTEDGTRCSHKGIDLLFPPDSNSGTIREFCTALFHEVETLSVELTKLQQFGVVIDWQNLASTWIEDPFAQAVQLNAAGDNLVLHLPVIHGHPKLLPALRGWLADQANGRASALSLSARDLDWQPQGEAFGREGTGAAVP